MRPVKVTSPAAVGVSSPVVLDQYLTPTSISLGVEFGTAVATCKVQYSIDDPFATYATDYNTNAVWYDYPEINNITVNHVGTINFPARAVRLSNSAWTSGQPTLTVIQAGIRYGEMKWWPILLYRTLFPQRF